MLRASLVVRATTLRVACLSLTPKGTSVGAALAKLGYRVYDLESAMRPQRAKTDAAAWTPFLQGRGHLDLTVLREHDAVAGLPASGNPERLIAELPEYTKVILVVEEDKEGWTAAYQRSVPGFLGVARKLARRGRMAGAWSGMFHAMFPAKDIRGNPIEPLVMLDTFEDTVKQRVPPHRLLVFHPGDGWGPLLHFLELPSNQTPKEDFPPSDHGEETYRVLTNRMTHAFYYSTGVLYFVVGIVLVGLGPTMFEALMDLRNTDEAMASAKAMAGRHAEISILPTLDKLAPEVGEQGRQALGTLGIQTKETPSS